MKTERLELAPMTAEEVFALAESCGDAELAKAYREMGDGVLKYPDQALWYTAWRIVLNKTGKTVGDLCFKGLPDFGRPEIGYGILPEWEGKGLCHRGGEGGLQLDAVPTGGGIGGSENGA